MIIKIQRLKLILVYEVQKRAPKAVGIEPDTPVRISTNFPSCYKSVYHGHISKEVTDKRLGPHDGAFLIRESPSAPGRITLTIR